MGVSLARPTEVLDPHHSDPAPSRTVPSSLREGTAAEQEYFVVAATLQDIIRRFKSSKFGCLDLCAPTSMPSQIGITRPQEGRSLHIW